jgi:hypothetical protein
MKKFIILAVVLLASSFYAISQDSVETPRVKTPVLNGHTFPSVISYHSPFINTSFLAIIGLGQTSTLTIPGFNIGEYEIFAFEGRLLFSTVTVNYQQRFNDWLALYISPRLAVRLGTDMSTILVDGVNTISGGEIGWLIKIYEGKKVYLSGSLGIRNITGSFINVRDYFAELINNNPDPSVSKVIPSMSVTGGLSFAYAISPTFGMQVSAGYAYGESLIRGETNGFYNGGIVFDADFNPAKRVPVGITLGLNISSAPEVVLNYQGPTNIGIAGLNYTGSDDFELGLQYHISQIISEKFSNDASLSTAMIVFKYYF